MDQLEHPALHLWGHYADTTRSLHYGHYAVTTRSLRGHYGQVTTRSLRGHYAVTTRSLRGHYAATRSLCGHYGHYAVTTVEKTLNFAQNGLFNQDIVAVSL